MAQTYYLPVAKFHFELSPMQVQSSFTQTRDYLSKMSQYIYFPLYNYSLVGLFLQILITENPKSFSHFITNLCAIIGGVFTVSNFSVTLRLHTRMDSMVISDFTCGFFQVAGILDSIFHNTVRLVKKVELGKNI